jgi:hypothetical protein
MQISGTLADLADPSEGFQVSQTVDQATHAGIVVYADTPRLLSTLAALNDNVGLQRQFLSISSTNFVNTPNPNLLT